MARNRIHTLVASGRDACGFTLLEIMTVCAILGILAVLAFPSLRRFNQAQETKAGATKMAGVLEEARSRAVSEGTPYLVFVNDPATGGGSGSGGTGSCGSIATVVRDLDRSYSVTDGDQLRDYSLPPEACRQVKLYAQDDTAAPIEDLRLPTEDQSVLSSVLGAVTDVVSTEGSSSEETSSTSESGSTSSDGSTSSSLRSETVADAVVNGSTFPIDATSGRPVTAFSERGIPVDPQHPTSWGSGAGAIYLTDGADTVYAAVVAPMGNIKLRKYDSAANAWR